MNEQQSVQVGVRELKNRLTFYLRLAKQDQDVIVTERGKPIAVIQALSANKSPKSLDARIAALAARGEIRAPQRRRLAKIRPVKIAGRPLSEQILADRR